MKKKLLSFTFLLLAFSLFIPLITSAQGSGSIINPQDAKYEEGNYQLNDFVSIATWAAQWILGIIGSLTLLMFIYGGFIFLISGGSKEKISEAKKIITAAIIGLIIVFASYMIIRFVVGALGMEWEGRELKQTAMLFLKN